MDYKEEYDAEIDLKDMLFYVLRRWRSLLLAGFLLCMLLSAYKAIVISRLTPEEQIPKKVKEYEYELAQYNFNVSGCERGLENTSELLEQQQIYMEKSVLMRVNPYNKPIAAADIFVHLDDAEWEGLPNNLGVDPTDSLIKMYTSSFSSILDWEAIEELTGNEKLYLEEILGVGADYNSNTITVQVIYSDGKMAKEILDIILNQILGREEELANGVGKHKLMVSNRSLTYAIDRSLAESQKANIAAVSDYERSITDYQWTLDELKENEPKEPFIIGFIKYPIAGFVAGIFLMAISYGVGYLLGGKLHGERELQSRYGYVLLGAFPKKQRTRFLSTVDYFLDKLAGVSTLSEERVCQRIVLNLKSRVGEKKRILLTGTTSINRLEALAEKISEELSEIEFIPATDVGIDVKALELIDKCDGILLVEEEGIASLAKIREECYCFAVQGKPVVGYVLL